MSHHIYHTDSFILGSRDSGEANRVFSFYTKELGLVYAHAQGVRLGKSKLRFVLQDFGMATVDLVKGKEIWRVTSARPIIFELAYKNTDKNLNADIYKMLGRVFNLLERLAPEAEANEEVYEHILNMYEYLGQSDVTDLALIEVLFALKILASLGYIGDDKMHNKFIKVPFHDIDFGKVESERKSIINFINYALKESHL